MRCINGNPDTFPAATHLDVGWKMGPCRLVGPMTSAMRRYVGCSRHRCQSSAQVMCKGVASDELKLQYSGSCGRRQACCLKKVAIKLHANCEKLKRLRSIGDIGKRWVRARLHQAWTPTVRVQHAAIRHALYLLGLVRGGS